MNVLMVGDGDRGDDWSALPQLTLATGPMTLGAVLLRIEDGKTQSITRIR